MAQRFIKSRPNQPRFKSTVKGILASNSEFKLSSIRIKGVKPKIEKKEHLLNSTIYCLLQKALITSATVLFFRVAPKAKMSFI